MDEFRYERSAEVVFRELGDATMLINLATGQMYELNTTATRLWQLLGDGLGPAEIADRLQLEYSVEREDVRKEIAAALRFLHREQLVVRS